MLCLSSSPSTDISEAQHVRGRPAVSQTHHHHHQTDRKCRPSADGHTQRRPDLSSNHSFIVIIISIPLEFPEASVDARVLMFDWVCRRAWGAIKPSLVYTTAPRLTLNRKWSVKRPWSHWFYSDCRGSPHRWLVLYGF